MASVTSLDGDLRKLRLDKYTPGAAKECKDWIEEVLGERFPAADLLEGLKDGVVLCKLVNRAAGPPGIKFKQSAMPFVQMENISHFLRACRAAPFNLPEHDVFLTVDLYEQKDPAQVIQCLRSFSRAASQANPSAIPHPMGPLPSRGGVVSPQSTGPTTPTGLRNRGMSTASNSSMYGRPGLVSSKTGDSGSGRWSPTKSPTGNTPGSPGWGRKDYDTPKGPDWNLAHYPSMGGASQGNLGISFGGRRQITAAGPFVPSLADKERRRKEQEAEAERQRQQMEEEKQRRQAEMEAEEERARQEEQRRWEEETKRQREKERQKAEEEKKRWAEEERQWQLTEEKRRQAEKEAEMQLQQERQRSRSKSDARLRGQFLSQYQAEQETSDQDGYKSRVKELEQELELARQREAEYERERQGGRSRLQADATDKKSRARSRSRAAGEPSRQDSWSVRDERDFLSAAHNQYQQESGSSVTPSRPVPPRPLPDPTASSTNTSPTMLKNNRTGGDAPPPVPLRKQNTGEVPPPVPIRKQNTGSRPLPDPASYAQQQQGNPTPRARQAPPQVHGNKSRTDRYLQTNPAPEAAPTPQTYSREVDATAERDAEDRRRAAAQKQTKAGGWASKSLLEREMEMERERQREWEEAQKETAKAVVTGDGVDGIGGGIGGRWDVSQWTGYTGGDNQNRGTQGIGAGRRQIVGPRPLPGSR